MRISLLGFLLWTSFFQAHAQLEIGVKGGINYRNMLYHAGETPVDNSTQLFTPGFMAGLYATYPLSERFFAHTEAIYQEKGFKYNDFFNPIGKISVRYFSVPVMLRYKLVGINYVEAGLEAGIRQKALSRSNGQTSDVTGFYQQRIDAAALGGIAWRFTEIVWAGARLNYGLNSAIGQGLLLDDNTGQPIPGVLRARHVVMQFWVGFTLP